MKKKISALFLATLSVGLFFSSCKKTENPVTTDTVTEYQVQSDDQSRFSNETDAADNDVNAALENSGGSYAGERPLSPGLPAACDATINVDTVSVPRKITITYNGGGCIGNRTRTGVVIVTFSPDFKWGSAGAQYTVTYQDLKITRKSDTKSITINGTRTVTNVSGGRLRNLASRTTPIIHEIKSNGMTLTFDDGKQRSWQVAKRRTFTYDNGVVISVAGIGAAGSGVAEWGQNRYGNNFTSAILEPLVVKQICDFRLVSGKIQHTGPVVTTTTTFGLDENGNPVTSCPSGDFYYKIVWTGPNGNSHTFIRSY